MPDFRRRDLLEHQQRRDDGISSIPVSQGLRVVFSGIVSANTSDARTSAQMRRRYRLYVDVVGVNA